MSPRRTKPGRLIGEGGTPSAEVREEHHTAIDAVAPRGPVKAHGRSSVDARSSAAGGLVDDPDHRAAPPVSYVVVDVPEAELRRRRGQIAHILAGMFRRAAG